MNIISFIIGYFLIFTNLISQNAGYQSGSASVNLIMPLSIEAAGGELDFGDIIVTNSPTLEKIHPQSGKEFVVKGQQNRNVSVVFNDVELNNHVWLSNHSGQAGNLTFVPEILSESSTYIKSGDNLILAPKGLIGEIKFQVGGSINLKANQPAGDYEGQFIISVTY